MAGGANDSWFHDVLEDIFKVDGILDGDDLVQVVDLEF